MVLFYFYFHFVLFGFSVRRSTGFPFRNTHQQLDLSMWCGNRSRRVSGECVLRVRMHSLRSFDWDTVVHRQIRFRTVSWRWRTQRYVQTTALHTTRESGRCFKLTRIFETPLIPIHTATHSIGHRSTVGVRVYSVDFSFWQIQYLLCRGGYVVMLKHRLRCTDHLLSGISQRCSMLGARGFYVFYQHEKIHSISSPVFSSSRIYSATHIDDGESGERRRRAKWQMRIDKNFIIIEHNLVAVINAKRTIGWR